MKRLAFFLSFFFVCCTLSAQQESDSSQTLQELTIRAYEQNRKLMQVPAAVIAVNKSQLAKFNNTSLLPALNSNPGIRMEERSPGSYRLNIRGSSLRSPFGVRNVKTYYNDIPYTDPGGNTYLNQLGFYNIRSLEIIKGPGSSLYGAGTGGVLLLNSDPQNWRTGLSFDFSAGNYGLNNLNTNLRLGRDAFQNTINYLQLSSNGYRDHTELDRKVFTWDIKARLSDKGEIHGHFLWGDLFYQTPGALTYTEYTSNPRAARPRAGASPGAEENKAAIYQELFFAGMSFRQKLGEYWDNTTSFYGAGTKLKNPSIRNYGRTSEPHTGGRSVFRFDKETGPYTRLKLVGGIEFQQGLSSVRIYANKSGNPDTLQTDDEINNRIFLVFSQATIELFSSWFITAGVSVNSQRVVITRLSSVPFNEQKRKYQNEIAPRLAVLKRFSKSFSLYGSIARGFSPPTTAELLPSSGIISTNLDAESGINLETGIRGTLNRGRLYFDINAFHFGLHNTIVQRRDQNGADYFVNAGSTRQKGIESFLSWQVLNNKNKQLSSVKIWVSHTWHHFTYKDFKQLNADFSGKKLPSVAPHLLAAGADLVTKPGVYFNLNYYYSDPVPLNDANTASAPAFHLLGARTGWRKNLHPKVEMELFIAADNIFDVQYSLGNDINAFGSRYYNAAPGFNFTGGLTFHFLFK